MIVSPKRNDHSHSFYYYQYHQPLGRVVRLFAIVEAPCFNHIFKILCGTSRPNKETDLSEQNEIFFLIESIHDR